MGGFYARKGKRLLDLALVVLLAIPAAIAALGIIPVLWWIHGSPRLVLFSQTRVGHLGATFRILKFRTMRGTAEALRVTPFGRILRQTHLDELPQLLNVIRGEMSVIGPRPEMVEIEAWASRHVAGFRRRLEVLPGITGLAQVTQGYTAQDVEAYARKLALDEEYLRGVSPALDLSIAARTVLWMSTGRGWRWDPPRGVPVAREI